MRNAINLLLGGAALALPTTAAWAQSDVDSLMGLGVSELRGEMQSRYDAALTLTRDAAIYGADNPRYLWASQAKAQCGIALGFLKSSTRDRVSIGKCVDAANRMQVAAPPPPPPPLPQPVALPESCNTPLAGIVFFEWDSTVVPDSATSTIDSVVQSVQTCRWSHLELTGHADRSGSDAYNQALSQRRAQAVAAILEAKGVPAGVLGVSGHGESEPKVPTADGVREPQNRRVEIEVK